MADTRGGNDMQNLQRTAMTCALAVLLQDRISMVPAGARFCMRLRNNKCSVARPGRQQCRLLHLLSVSYEEQTVKISKNAI